MNALSRGDKTLNKSFATPAASSVYPYKYLQVVDKVDDMVCQTLALKTLSLVDFAHSEGRIVDQACG